MKNNFDDEFLDLLDILDCLVGTAKALSAISSNLPKGQKETVEQQADLINKSTEIMLIRLRQRINAEKAQING